MHTLKVRKPGDSLGVILPKERQHRLAVQAGDELLALDAPDGVTLTPYEPELEQGLDAFGELYRAYRESFRQLAK